MQNNQDEESHREKERAVEKAIPEEQHNVKFFNEETRDKVRELGCVIVKSHEEAAQGGKVDSKAKLPEYGQEKF